MPEQDILTQYYKMGGRKISIGSDAHVSKNVAVGFDKALEMIKSIGFDSYVIYKQRKAIFISI
jgi:histidinol-phosphatase (PHP family)